MENNLILADARNVLLSLGFRTIEGAKKRRTWLVNGYSFRCGAYRLCIIPKDKNFVIKTMRREAGRMMEQEVSVLEDAKEEGLGHFFAAFFGRVSLFGLSFYVYEKINMTCAEMGDDLPHLYTERTSYGYCNKVFTPFEGIKDLKLRAKLKDFCRSHSLYDLHDENLSFSEQTGQIVIIDYTPLGHCDGSLTHFIACTPMGSEGYNDYNETDNESYFHSSCESYT